MHARAIKELPESQTSDKFTVYSKCDPAQEHDRYLSGCCWSENVSGNFVCSTRRAAWRPNMFWFLSGSLLLCVYMQPLVPEMPL